MRCRPARHGRRVQGAGAVAAGRRRRGVVSHPWRHRAAALRSGDLRHRDAPLCRAVTGDRQALRPTAGAIPKDGRCRGGAKGAVPTGRAADGCCPVRARPASRRSSGGRDGMRQSGRGAGGERGCGHGASAGARRLVPGGMGGEPKRHAAGDGRAPGPSRCRRGGGFRPSAPALGGVRPGRGAPFAA